jgi:D-arabinose 5-phosphate isomerase GutQ
MENTIVTLTGITAPELAELGAEAFVSGQDLSMVTYEDIVMVLSTSGLLTRRKLSLVGQY